MTQQMTCNGSREATILPAGQLPPAHGREVGRKGLRRVKQTDIWQFLRFCAVGSLNAVIDFGVLNLLLWLYPTAITWVTLGYNSVAVLLAATNSFFWNKYWTFQKRDPTTFQEVYRFIVVASGTMLMNDTLMWLLGSIFPGILRSSLLGANVLKLGAIIGTMSISFFGMRLWVFFQHRFAGEAHTLTDYETEKLPALQQVYDVDTVVLGVLKPGHTIDIPGISAPGKPKSSRVASDAPISTSGRTSPLKTLIIIPTYNEIETLPLLLSEGLFFRRRRVRQRPFPVTFAATTEHRHVEGPRFFSSLQASLAPSYAPALPEIPLPGLQSEHTQVCNLRPVKLTACPPVGDSFEGRSQVE